MGNKKKFLVVDDLIMNRILLSEILILLGYPYEFAKNGKEAVDMVATNTFDIILMDIEMPVMNGIEATLAIKANKTLSKDIKIVGVTAHDPNRFQEDFENIPFDGFVTKPYSVERITSVLNRLI